MTDKAALMAAFSDFRLVKGRKVAQLIFEVPLENADAALRTLGGVPMPMSEVWCGIARMAPEPASDDLAVTTGTKPRRKWDELSYATQSGIRRNEPAFTQFLIARFPKDLRNSDAAQFIRSYCAVTSCADIQKGTHAAERWEFLEQLYQSWLKAAEHVA